MAVSSVFFITNKLSFLSTELSKSALRKKLSKSCFSSSLCLAPEAKFIHGKKTVDRKTFDKTNNTERNIVIEPELR